MSDVEDDAQAEEEEEEEAEVYTPIDTASMPNGSCSIVLGGFSTAQDVDSALRSMSEHNSGAEACGAAAALLAKTLIVYPGEYDRIDVTEEINNIEVIGAVESTPPTFKGCSVEAASCSVRDVSFAVSDDALCCLSVSCLSEKPVAKPSFTRCKFTGGKSVVQIHAHSKPVLVACTVDGTAASSKTGVYAYPRSAVHIAAGYEVLRETSLFFARPAAAGDEDGARAAKPLDSVAKGLLLPLLPDRAPADAKPDEAGVRWARTTYKQREGFVKRSDLAYTQPEMGCIVGNTQPAAVGVFFDDAAAHVRETEIKGWQTSIYMTDRCKTAAVEHCIIEGSSGVGVYADNGCRACVRNCRIKSCAHYGVLVASGPRGGDDEVSEMCLEAEIAESSGNTALLKTLREKLETRGVTTDGVTRTWTDTSTRETGRWSAPETAPIFRDNVVCAHIKVARHTSPSFFGNKLVQPHTFTSLASAAVNGIVTVKDEPKPAVRKRDDEEDA